MSRDSTNAEDESRLDGAQYFLAYNTSHASDDMDEACTFTWRGDPDKTYSDYKIILTSNEDGKQKTFFVHKGILAARSDYFKALFETHMTVSEQEDSTSKITFNGEQIEAFPLLLDHLYKNSPTMPLQGLTTEYALAIHSLAKYFLCKDLQNMVSGYIAKDISLSTEKAFEYYEKACALSDVVTMQSAKRIILDNNSKLKTENEELTLQNDRYEAREKNRQKRMRKKRRVERAANN